MADTGQITSGPSINAGKSFLTGQFTSVFAGSGAAGLSENIIGTVGQIQGTVKKVSSSLQNSVNGVVTTVGSVAGGMVGTGAGAVMGAIGGVEQVKSQIELAAKEVISYAGEKVTEKVMKLLTPPTDLIAYYTTERFSYYVADVPKDCLQKVLNPTEGLNQKDILSTADGAVQGFMEKINSAVGNVANKVNEFSQGLQEDFNQLAEYALAGPSWMGRKVDENKKNAKKQVSEFIEKESNSLMKLRDRFAYNAGDAAAKAAVEQIKKSTRGDVQKQFNKVEESKIKATTKAKTAAQKAILVVLGLVGA